MSESGSTGGPMVGTKMNFYTSKLPPRAIVVTATWYVTCRGLIALADGG